MDEKRLAKIESEIDFLEPEFRGSPPGNVCAMGRELIAEVRRLHAIAAKWRPWQDAIDNIKAEAQNAEPRPPYIFAYSEAEDVGEVKAKPIVEVGAKPIVAENRIYKRVSEGSWRLLVTRYPDGRVVEHYPEGAEPNPDVAKF